jgi:ribosomal protein S18 acetylase RimI-like enzyme
MQIDLRTGRAEDAEFFGRISLLSSRGHVGWGVYDVLLGGSDEYMLERLAGLATTRAVSFHHYSQRDVATVDGIPAASATGFTAGDEARRVRAQASAEVFTADELGRMLERRGPIDTCIIYSEPGTLIIENVATLPEYRRMSLQERVLKAVLERGIATGHKRAGVSVVVGNEAAERAYAKLGFQLVEEKTHPDFEAAMRSPGMRYLELAL